MNQNAMLIALLIGALLFLRPPRAASMGNAQMTGGAGTGYGIDQWGDEG
jgi:hypothetical protein